MRRKRESGNRPLASPAGTIAAGNFPFTKSSGLTTTVTIPGAPAQLGNALVYPTMPFAPTGNWGYIGEGVIDPAQKDGHMRFAGSVNLSEQTFGAVAHDVALSAISATRTARQAAPPVISKGGGSYRMMAIGPPAARCGQLPESTPTRAARG
jgi:hypothetical protein